MICICTYFNSYLSSQHLAHWLQSLFVVASQAISVVVQLVAAGADISRASHGLSSVWVFLFDQYVFVQIPNYISHRSSLLNKYNLYITSSYLSGLRQGPKYFDLICVYLYNFQIIFPMYAPMYFPCMLYNLYLYKFQIIFLMYAVQLVASPAEQLSLWLEAESEVPAASTRFAPISDRKYKYTETPSNKYKYK